jgi:hypothetical protein
MSELSPEHGLYEWTERQGYMFTDGFRVLYFEHRIIMALGQIEEGGQRRL